MTQSVFSLENGNAVSHCIVNDRAFSYADGVFETLLYNQNAFPLLEYHIERLELGCRRLGIQYGVSLLEDTLSAIERIICEHHYQFARVKLVVSRKLTQRGCYPQGGEGFGNIYASVTQHTPAQNESVELVKAYYPLYENPLLVGVKHLNRLNYVVAAKDNVLASHQELLFLDESMRCIETMHHNVFFIRDNMLFTPQISQAGVEGVMRRVIMEEYASNQQKDVDVTNIFYDELPRFDAAFICNALNGVQIVTSIDGNKMQSDCALLNDLIKFVSQRMNYER